MEHGEVSEHSDHGHALTGGSSDLELVPVFTSLDGSSPFLSASGQPLSPPWVPPSGASLTSRMMSGQPLADSSEMNATLEVSGFLIGSSGALRHSVCQDERQDLMIKNFSNTLNSTGGRLRPVPEQLPMLADEQQMPVINNNRGRRGSAASRTSAGGTEFSFHMGGARGESETGDVEESDQEGISEAVNAAPHPGSRRSWEESYMPTSPLARGAPSDLASAPAPESSSASASNPSRRPKKVELILSQLLRNVQR